MVPDRALHHPRDPAVPQANLVLLHQPQAIPLEIRGNQNQGKLGIVCKVLTAPRNQIALYQAAPLQGWALPEEFGTLRRLLESRMGRRGKREYVQVLRLLETFSQQEVAKPQSTEEMRVAAW